MQAPLAYPKFVGHVMHWVPSVVHVAQLSLLQSAQALVPPLEYEGAVQAVHVPDASYPNIY